MPAKIKIVSEYVPEQGEPLIVAEAPKIALKAERDYHNAQIPGGIGKFWKSGEIRAVTWQQYEQLVRDNPHLFMRMK